MKTSTSISFGKNALETAYDAVFTLVQGGQQPFADFEALRFSLTNLNSYATYEPDFWLLDGTYKFVPDTEANVGWMSTIQSASTSNFTAPVPELKITFSSVRSTSNLTLYFAAHSGDWADRIIIGYYDASNVLIRSDVYTPTGVVFSTNQAVANFKRIDIFLDSTNKPYRYSRLTGIDFDTVTRFSGESVQYATVIEQIDPMSFTLPINSIEVNLFSDSGAFDILDPTGLYASFQFRNPLDVREQVGNEVIFIGRYYLDTWESITNYQFHLTALDIIGVVDTIPQLGNLYGMGVLATTIIDDLLTPLGIPYEIAPYWTTFGIMGWLQTGTVREALHQMVYALSHSSFGGHAAVVNCSRSGKILIEDITLAQNLTSYDHTLSVAERGMGSSLSLKPLVTRVRILGHVLTGTTPVVEIYKDSLSAGEYTIIFGSPYMVATMAVTGATLTFAHVNYAILTVTTPGTVTLTGSAYVDKKTNFVVYNTDVPAGTAENIIKIDNAQLIGNNIALHKVTIGLAYFKQRYLEKATVYATKIRPGDSVLVTFPSGTQMKGIVEKMSSQLTGGFISNLEIVGVVA